MKNGTILKKNPGDNATLIRGNTHNFQNSVEGGICSSSMLKSTRYYEDPYFFFCLLSYKKTRQMRVFW